MPVSTLRSAGNANVGRWISLHSAREQNIASSSRGIASARAPARSSSIQPAHSPEEEELPEAGDEEREDERTFA